MAKLAGDHCIVICDDTAGTTKNISTDITSVDIQYDQDAHEVTAIAEDVHNFIAGQKVRGVTLNGFVNPTADRAHAVLSARAGSVGTLTVQVGNNAAPTTGDPEFEGEFLLQNYSMAISNAAAITFTATFVVSGSTAPAWGTV